MHRLSLHLRDHYEPTRDGTEKYFNFKQQYKGLASPLPGHDSLSVWADIQQDLHDLWFKSHIQHPVCFVQNLPATNRVGKRTRNTTESTVSTGMELTKYVMEKRLMSSFI